MNKSPQSDCQRSEWTSLTQLICSAHHGTPKNSQIQSLNHPKRPSIHIQITSQHQSSSHPGKDLARGRVSKPLAETVAGPTTAHQLNKHGTTTLDHGQTRIRGAQRQWIVAPTVMVVRCRISGRDNHRLSRSARHHRRWSCSKQCPPKKIVPIRQTCNR